MTQNRCRFDVRLTELHNFFIHIRPI